MFVCICKFSLIKSAPKLLFAFIPPTLAADKITILGLFICKNFHLLDAFYSKIFDWLFKCEEIFKEFNLDTYGKKRIYGFLAERYLPFWFKENSKTLDWPYVYFDTNRFNK